MAPYTSPTPSNNDNPMAMPLLKLNRRSSASSGATVNPRSRAITGWRIKLRRLNQIATQVVSIVAAKPIRRLSGSMWTRKYDCTPASGHNPASTASIPRA